MNLDEKIIIFKDKKKLRKKNNLKNKFILIDNLNEKI
jgi:hypothetical protein